MKTMKMSIAVVFLFTTFACTAQKDVVVGSDAKPDTDFEEFKTYYWATNAADAGNLKYTLNDVNLKDELREAIKYEMNARGYKVSESDPDLLVNFRVMEEDAEFTGYSNVNEFTGYWSTSIDDATLTEDGKRTYDLEKGTVLIDIVDADEAVLIWQGYASGVLDPSNTGSEGTKNDVKDAVQRVFTEYDYRASEDTSSRSTDY